MRAWRYVHVQAISLRPGYNLDRIRLPSAIIRMIDEQISCKVRPRSALALDDRRSTVSCRAVHAYSRTATPKAAAPTTPAQSCDNRFAAPVYVDGAGAELLATTALLVNVAGALAGTDDEAVTVDAALLAVAGAVGSVMVTLADAQNETAN